MFLVCLSVSIRRNHLLFKKTWRQMFNRHDLFVERFCWKQQLWFQWIFKECNVLQGWHIIWLPPLHFQRLNRFTAQVVDALWGRSWVVDLWRKAYGNLNVKMENRCDKCWELQSYSQLFFLKFVKLWDLKLIVLRL